MSPFGGTLGVGPAGLGLGDGFGRFGRFGGLGGLDGLGDAPGRFVGRLFGRIFGVFRAMYSAAYQQQGFAATCTSRLIFRAPMIMRSIPI